MKENKLTDKNGQTQGSTQWGEGVTHTAPGTGNLCSSGWIHTYSHPLLAVLLNPAHADFSNPKLWECEVSGSTRDDCGLKQGWESVTTVREIPVPVVTVEQRVRFAILCAKEVCQETGFVLWADRWLTGEDRSARAASAAWSAAEAAWAKAASAAWAKAASAAWSAWAAARAAATAARAKSINFIALAEEAVEAQAG